MYELVGATTGNWKRDFAYFQRLKGEPNFAPVVNKIEEGILAIDTALAKSGFVPKGVPGGFADTGGYADIKSMEKKIAGIKAVEMPELVRIAKKLTGDTPSMKKFRKSLGKFYAVDQGAIKLDPEIFKDPVLAAKVMAHEIGHATDFLEDRTMARGNLVGRIASLQRHMKDKFGNLENKAIKEELKSLTQKWKPFDETAVPEGYKKYRYSSKELYADSISVLFNDPSLLQKEAPKFWKGFFDHIDAKPSVKKNFFAIWDLINQGEEAVFKARDEELSKSFEKGEQEFAARELERQKRRTGILFQIQTLFDDKNTPLIRKVKQARKEGKYIDPALNPEFALHGFNYTDGKLKNYVNDNFQPIFEKAQSVSDGWDTLGKVLFYERVINERGELANPQGYDPKTAKDQLEMMEKETSKEEWKTIQESKELLRKAVKKSVDMAEKNGFYTPELIKQMKMNPAYATFQVVDYLDTYISSRVYQSVGTLKDIANPATSTIMKLVSVHKAIERNNVKKLSIDHLKTNFPESVVRARTRWNGRFMEVRDPSDPNTGLVITIENGDPQGYYLDKDIADTLNYNSNKTLHAMARVARAVSFSPFYRPLFTTFNLGFQTFNFVRDFMRYWKNVPDFTIGRAITSFPRAIARYAQAAPHAGKRVLNLKDDLIKEMENAKILGLTYADMFASRDVDENRQQIEKVLERAGVLQNTKRTKLFTPFYWVLDSISAVGNFIETLPKVAGYIELKDKMPEAELAEFIRTSVGSPDFRIGGTATPVSNNIFLFSNAIKEGIKTDMKIAFTKNQSRAGFWWKTVASTFMPKFIMATIVAGLFGDELKEIMDKASEYDKTNYIIVPLGLDENKKAVYLRVAQDETGRLFGALLWKLINLSKDDATIQDVFDIFSFGAGQFPNLSPNFTGAGALTSYLSGKNPYDSFRGRNIVPDTEFKAGTKYSLPIFMRWLAKNQGLGIFFPTNKKYYGVQMSDLEKLLDAPFISNILGRWIKVSDYGLIEKGRKEVEEPIIRERAIKNLEKRKAIDEAVERYKEGESMRSLERELVKQVLGDPPYNEDEKRVRTNLIKKFKIATQEGSNPDLDLLIDANTNQIKVEHLIRMEKRLSGAEFDNVVRIARKYKIISDDAWKQFRKERRKQSVNIETKLLTDLFLKANEAIVKEALAAEEMPDGYESYDLTEKTFKEKIKDFLAGIFKKEDVEVETTKVKGEEYEKPYRLETLPNGLERIHYPTGGYTDVGDEQTKAKYLAEWQSQYKEITGKDWPSYAPNWIGTGKERKEKAPKSKEQFRNPAIKDIPLRATKVRSINKWADYYGVPRDLATDIAFAESSLDTNKKSKKSSAEGYYQFLDKTWNWLKELGVIPSDAKKTDPDMASKAAMWSIANNNLSWWNESKWNWGKHYKDSEIKKFYGQ